MAPDVATNLKDVAANPRGCPYHRTHPPYASRWEKKVTGGIPCRASALYCTARQPGYRLEGIAASESSQEAPTEAGMVPGITTDPGHNTSRGLGGRGGGVGGACKEEARYEEGGVGGGMGSLFPTKVLIPRTHVWLYVCHV